MIDPLEALRTALEGRYAVERKIGEGGMASVYLARDGRHDRPVAIKVLRPELAASLGADRFLREIKVAANLQHPNILALYDSGEAGGFLYYVMPFVEGESLRARLDRETQLSLPDAIQLTCEVAEALQCAHQHNIIHRDIKPENILIQSGHALVADFGIARALSQAGADKLTETGMAVGTPHYMSPEQGLGGNNLDGRSDEYSLACVTYEMLVGQPPFEGPNAMAILARHSMEGVPSLQIVRQSIPDEVEEAIMRALEKTPADRFATVAEFGDALLQADLGPGARRTSSRAMKAVRRTTPRGVPTPRKPSRGRLIAIAGAAVAVLAGTGWGAWRYWHSPEIVSAAATGGFDPHRIAVLYFGDQSTGDSLRYVGDGLTEGLIRELGEVPGLDVISSGGVAQFRDNALSRDSIARALKAGTLVVGDLERTNGRLRVTARLVDGASGADFARASFEQPAGNLLSVQDTLADKVAALIRERLGEEIRLRAQLNSSHNTQAWALVQQANVHRKLADSAAQGTDSSFVERQFHQADSLLARAESLDAAWIDPAVLRGTIAYRRARLAVDDPLTAGKSIEIGLQHAEHALSLAPQNPDALELRGDLRYLKWLLNLAPDPTQARELLKSAQDDLEAAVRIAPSQAGAWAMLSHLYYQSGSQVDVKLAARRAYEEDAYLSNADVVLSRLFFASYDLGQLPDALHWCQEGQRRFPSNPKFAECRLWLLTTKATDPDVTKAWQLTDTLVNTAAAQDKEYQRLNAQILVAGVLARAGLADSARHLLTRSRGRPEIDPTRDLLYTAAIVRTMLGDKSDAVKALKSYLAINPEKRSALAEDPGWLFRPLQNDAEFQKVVGSQQ